MVTLANFKTNFGLSSVFAVISPEICDLASPRNMKKRKLLSLEAKVAEWWSLCMMISVGRSTFPQFHCWHCSRLVVQFFPSCSCFCSILMFCCISFLLHSALGVFILFCESSSCWDPQNSFNLSCSFSHLCWWVSLYHSSTWVLHVCAVTVVIFCLCCCNIQKHREDESQVKPALTKPKEMRKCGFYPKEL